MHFPYRICSLYLSLFYVVIWDVDYQPVIPFSKIWRRPRWGIRI